VRADRLPILRAGDVPHELLDVAPHRVAVEGDRHEPRFGDDRATLISNLRQPERKRGEGAAPRGFEVRHVALRILVTARATHGGKKDRERNTTEHPAAVSVRRWAARWMPPILPGRMSAQAPTLKPDDPIPGTKYTVVRTLGAGGM